MEEVRNRKLSQQLETSLMETIGHSELQGLASVGAELALDSLLENGLLREIPVVKTLSAIYKLGVSVRNYLFMKKIIGFLSPIASVSQEERRSFVNRLEADRKFKRKVGENLILLLDRLDDIDKPELVGRLFKAYMLGQIKFDDFKRLASSVDRLYLPDLSELEKYYRGNSANEEVSQRLALHGLLDFYVETRIGKSVTIYSISALGRTLIKMCSIKSNSQQNSRTLL